MTAPPGARPNAEQDDHNRQTTVNDVHHKPTPHATSPNARHRKRTTAILDRLLHHCDVININGPSYRLKDRLTLVNGGENMP